MAYLGLLYQIKILRPTWKNSRLFLGPDLISVPNQRENIGGNSQTCLCGHPVPKNLNERIHFCPSCGLLADRDLVSANIVEHVAFLSHHVRRTGSPPSTLEAMKPSAVKTAHASPCPGLWNRRRIANLMQPKKRIPRMGNLPWQARLCIISMFLQNWPVSRNRFRTSNGCIKSTLGSFSQDARCFNTGRMSHFCMCN